MKNLLNFAMIAAALLATTVFASAGAQKTKMKPAMAVKHAGPKKAHGSPAMAVKHAGPKRTIAKKPAVKPKN